MSTKKIAVIGGDRRQAILAAMLAADGYECAVFALEDGDIGGATKCMDLQGALAEAEAVVLPLPVSRDSKRINAPFCKDALYMDTLDATAPKGVPFLGGMIKQADFPNHPVFDYYGKEELQLLNTIPTAEGAIAIAMNALPTTLHGTKTLIMGFGRVGKTLGLMLRGVGANVSVATRNPAEKAVCSILGFDVVEYSGLKDSIGGFGLIFNTVPTVLLTKELLSHVSADVPIIDLATHPGGVDADASKAMGKNVIWALGLPGKVAPVTSGAYIKTTVLAILKQEGIL